MEQYIQYIDDELVRLIPYFYIISIVVLLAIVINTTVCYGLAKSNHFIYAVILFIENVMLSLSLLVGLMIDVLMLDQLGQTSYAVFNPTVNNITIIWIVSAVVCLINLILVVRMFIERKH